MEDPKYYLKGYLCELFVYDNRVVIDRNRHGALRGFAGSKTIPFSSIKSVQYKGGGTLLNGYIQFGVLGGMEAQNGIFDAAKDENSVIFTSDKNNRALEIKNYVEKIILDKQRLSQPSTSIPANSAADELLKYKQLLDMGALTQAEFDAKKRQLLGL